MTFKTPKPATYMDPDTGQEFSLTFDAQGTTTPSGPQAAKMTNGTIQEHVSGSNGNGPQSFTGNITSRFYSTNHDPPYITFYSTIQNADYYVESACTTSADNPIVAEPFLAENLVVRLNVLLLKVEETLLHSHLLLLLLLLL